MSIPYEQLRLLDTWLRQELVPGLRDNTRLVLAGREPPVAAWIIVSRAALLRDVWGYDWTGGSNVVEVVISALRRKLGGRGPGWRRSSRPARGAALPARRGGR